MSRTITVNRKIACSKCDTVLKTLKEKMSLSHYKQLEKENAENTWHEITDNGPQYYLYQQSGTCRAC